MAKSLYNAAEVNHIKVGTSVKNPTHDISLTSNTGDTLGLVLANKMGMNDPKAILLSSMPRTAMKMGQGQAGYDSMELPFITEVQETWVGGRAQETFSNDRTRFYDSYRMDTTRQYPVCAPDIIEQTGIAKSTDIWMITDEQSLDPDISNFFVSDINKSILFRYLTEAETIIVGMRIKYKLPYGGTLYYSVSHGDVNSAPTATDTPGDLQYSISMPDKETAGNFIINFPSETVPLGEYIYIILHVVPNSNVFSLPNPLELYLCGKTNGYSFRNFDTVWTAYYEYGMFWGVIYSSENYDIKFFEYKRQMYAILNKSDKDAASLYMNGYRGCADSNSSNKNKLIDATQTTWTANAAELIGAIVLIINGAGEKEDYPWRVITGAADGYVTVDRPWIITHSATTTEYVILGTNIWTAISGHGLTKSVKDVAVLTAYGKGTTNANREYVMFAQSSAAACRFMREYNDSGTWKQEYCAIASTQWNESTDTNSLACYADFIKVGQLETGETVLWRARKDDSKVDYSFIGAWDASEGNSWIGTNAMLYFDINRNIRNDLKILRARLQEDYVDEMAKDADEQDVFFQNSLNNQMEDATNQITFDDEATFGESGETYYGTFRTAHQFLPYYISCGNLDSDITNMILYGTPKIPYIFKEDGIGSIYNNIYQEIPLEEMTWVRSEHNGKAAMHYGVYLYFSLESGRIERYYDMRLDDVSPTRDEGLPVTRQGEISKLLPYPSRYYAAIDAGATGISSILCNNELGWHEIYRAHSTGSRITDIYIQAIPGVDNPDRLWFSESNNVKALPIAINPIQQNNYSFYGYGIKDDNNLGYIETSWIDFGFKDVNKYFHSITLFSDYGQEMIRSGQEYKIVVWFKIDGDSKWTKIGFSRAETNKEILIKYTDRFDSSSHNASGKKIKFKIAMSPTLNRTKTPRLRAIVISGILRMPIKRSWNITFHLEPMKDLQDRPLTDTPGLIYDKIYEWANSVTHNTPLLMRTNDVLTDNKYVFIDAPSISSFQALQIMGDGSAQKEYRHIGQLILYEV